MKSYLEQLETDLSHQGLPIAIRNIVNWCHGTLMTITQIRLNNMKNHGDPDYVTMDNTAGEADPQRQVDGKDQVGLTLTQRADCFASIRAAALSVAESKGWTNFDKPIDMRAYMDFRIGRVRQGNPTAEEINEFITAVGGAVSTIEAESMLKIANIQQAGKLEGSKEDVLAEQSTYDDGIDLDEALGSLPVSTQHRLRVKMVDGFMQETDRLLLTIARFLKSSPVLAAELIGKRVCLMADAALLDDQMNQFEDNRQADIDKELNGTGRTLSQPTNGHLDRLDDYRKEQARRLALEKAVMEEQLKRKAA